MKKYPPASRTATCLINTAAVVLLLPLGLSAQRDKQRIVLGDTRPVTVSAGEWTLSPEGAPLYRASVESAGAAAIRLHFVSFRVEGRVRVLAAREHAENEVQGWFSQAGPNHDGDFWTGMITGDRAIVEFEPAGDPPSEIPFQIAEAGHFFGSNDKHPTRSIAGCHVDVTRYPQWQTAASAVALLVFQTTWEGQTFWTACSGAALRDRLDTKRPYILTANHCIATEQEARTVEAYFGFQTASPDGLPYTYGFGVNGGFGWNPAGLSNTLSRVAGARILAYAGGAEGDFTLLGMNSLLPASVVPATLASQPVEWNTPVATIHHPDGSWKRVAFSQTRPVMSGQDAGFRVDTSYRPSDYFYKTVELVGITDYGSSGSSLFLAPNSVAGVLSYGPPVSCAASMGMYGRSYTFFPRVQSLLNNTAPGACQAQITGINQWIGTAFFTGTFQLTAPPDCPWAVAADNDWIAVTPRYGTGNATITFMAEANTSSSQPTPPRLGSFSVLTEQRRVVHITQKGQQTWTGYNDVPATHAFAGEIQFLVGQGLVVQCVESQFCPERVTTRAEMAEFIIRSIYPGGFTATPTGYFQDVPPSHPQFLYIQKMKDLRITDGCGATSYCPHDPVTREQLAAFMIRAMQVRNGSDSRAEFAYHPGPYFNDVPASNMFFSYIQKMRELGITSGCGSAAQYCPLQLSTRGQIAVFVARALHGLWEGRFE